ncbi:hypothetical protein [Luteimonas sp. A478]
MAKLFSTIGCCLLLAVPVAGCQQRPVATSGVTESVSTQMHDEFNRQVGMAAAQAWGWNPDDVMIESLAGTEALDCRLLGLTSPNALPNLRRTVAVVDGEVVLPGSAGALDRVITACGADASAEAWAEAVAAFGVPRPGYVVRREQEVSSLAHRRAMDNGGYALHAPRFSRDEPGARAVEFFMTDVEGAELFRVTAIREGNGPVQVSAGPAGGS